MTEPLKFPAPADDSALDRRGFLFQALAGGLTGVKDGIAGTATRIRRGAAALKAPVEGHDPCLSPRGPRRFTSTGRKG